MLLASMSDMLMLLASRSDMLMRLASMSDMLMRLAAWYIFDVGSLKKIRTNYPF